MPKYIYDGPVMEFNTCIADHWKGETFAPSESKARSNLAYQFKKNNKRIASSKIILPGQLIEIWHGRRITNGHGLQTKFS